MLTNTLIDNSDGRTLLKFIHEIMAEAEPLDEILIATGYWDIPGLSLLAKSLDIFLKKPNTKLKIDLTLTVALVLLNVAPDV